MASTLYASRASAIRRHAAAACAAASLAASAQTNAPRIDCSEPVWDFGTRDSATDVEHTFTIRNAGTAPLSIIGVRPGCGCARAEAGTNVLAPGKTAGIATRITLRGIVGEKRTSIFVHSNDPTCPVFSLECRGAASAELEIQPRQLDFAVRGDGSRATQTVTLAASGGAPFHVLAAVPSHPFFTAAVSTNEDGRSYRLAVEAVSAAPGPPRHGALAVLTDRASAPLVEIPVTVAAYADVTAFPSEIVVREGEEKPQFVHVVLRSKEGKNFTVAGVAPPAGTNVPVVVQSTKPAWVRIKVGPLPPIPAIDGTFIRVQTAGGVAETLTIPIRLERRTEAATP